MRKKVVYCNFKKVITKRYIMSVIVMIVMVVIFASRMIRTIPYKVIYLCNRLY